VLENVCTAQAGKNDLLTGDYALTATASNGGTPVFAKQ